MPHVTASGPPECALHNVRGAYHIGYNVHGAFWSVQCTKCTTQQGTGISHFKPKLIKWDLFETSAF